MPKELRASRRPLVGPLANFIGVGLLGAAAVAVPASAAADTGATLVQEPPPTDPVPGIVYEGSGTQVLPIELPDPAEVAVATISHTGESNFAIWELDEDLEQVSLAVNTIGDYSGTVPLNLSADATTTSLEITADGSWRIDIRTIWEIRYFDADIDGAGDDVVAYLGDTQVVAVTHDGDANFALWSHGEESELLINEIGPYNATVPLPGPAVLVIVANGPWSIRPG